MVFSFSETYFISKILLFVLLANIFQRIKREFVEDLQFDSREKVEKLIEEEKLSEALIMTNMDLRSYPNNESILSKKGDILFDLERFHEATFAYEKAFAINPDEKSYYANLGMCYDEIEEYEKSLEYLNKYLDESNFSDTSLEKADILSEKAEVLTHLDRREEALEITREVLEINPDDIEEKYTYASTLSDVGKFSESNEIIDKILLQDPEDSDIWVLKSYNLTKLGNFEDAVKSCETAIEINPNDDVAMTNKATALIEMGNLEEAQIMITSSIDVDSANDDSWYQQARILAKQDKIEDSLDSLLVSVSLDDDNKELAKSEKDFTNLQNTNRFKKIIS